MAAARTEHRWVNALSSAAIALASVALLALMGYVVLNIVLRHFGAPLPGVTEISGRWLMVPLALAGIAVAQFRGEHLTVDFLVGLCGRRLRRTLLVVALVLDVVFMAMVAYFGLFGALDAHETGELGIDSGLPLWPTRYLVPVCGALFLLGTWVLWRAASHEDAPSTPEGA